jgi:hypothetical protein
VNRARHLVDILPTRPLRPNGGDGGFGFVDVQHF